MNLGIVGVTGVVGTEMLNCLENLNIEINKLKLFSSKKNIGNKIVFKKKEYILDEINEDSFYNLNYVLFAVNSNLSKIFYTYAKKHKCIVIDNSSAFRLKKDYPLIIPEINSNLLRENEYDLISNPNCSTILLNLTLYKIYKIFGLKRIVVSTYQAASGAGIEGLKELENQCIEFSKEKKVKSKNIFKKQYIWNVFSHNSDVNLINGYNEEELKIINETKKIFNNDKINITATCVRVPVFRAHCESINITLEKSATEEEIRNLLINTEGIKIMDDRINNNFPEPILTSNKYDIYVGRIRPDLSQEKNKGYELFISGDQILKGAALNAVQILNVLSKMKK